MTPFRLRTHRIAYVRNTVDRQSVSYDTPKRAFLATHRHSKKSGLAFVPPATARNQVPDVDVVDQCGSEAASTPPDSVSEVGIAGWLVLSGQFGSRAEAGAWLCR